MSATPGHGHESDQHLSSQADFLASALANVDPTRFHDLHMAQSVLALPDHLAVFERGIANRLDFPYAGPQSRRLAELVASKALKTGAIHTLELYPRTLVDPTPQVALQGLGFVIPSPTPYLIDHTPTPPKSGTRTS
jgi:hypothetical protein